MQIALLGANSKFSTGLAIGQSLIEQGHSVSALTTFDLGRLKVARGEIQYFQGELDDPAVRRILDKADAVIDAELPTVLPSDKIRTADVRPCRLRRALAGTGKTLIVTSNSGVLGDTGPVPLDEKAPVHPFRGFRFLPAMEREILQARDVHGIVIRPALEHGRSVLFPLQYWISLAKECGRGTWLKSGKNSVSAVHSDDLADLYSLAIHKVRPGMVIHGAAETVSIREVAAAIHRGMGFPGEPAGITLAEAQHYTIARAARGLCRSHAISGDFAKRALGWRPTRRSILDAVAEKATEERRWLPKKP